MQGKQLSLKHIYKDWMAFVFVNTIQEYRGLSIIIIKRQEMVCWLCNKMMTHPQSLLYFFDPLKVDLGV